MLYQQLDTLEGSRGDMKRPFVNVYCARQSAVLDQLRTACWAWILKAATCVFGCCQLWLPLWLLQRHVESVQSRKTPKGGLEDNVHNCDTPWASAAFPFSSYTFWWHPFFLCENQTSWSARGDACRFASTLRIRGRNFQTSHISSMLSISVYETYIK